jgi:hypothetical protein
MMRIGRYMRGRGCFCKLFSDGGEGGETDSSA